ncbi:unnamed protein product, partial [Gongylonema pulchrum]|uniref:WD_REPEATS_REGION domain-containing protein n=1 Tax=Gongylonema pulchrum TaxID=637853 RepID=A0A183EG46_9BILA
MTASSDDDTDINLGQNTRMHVYAFTMRLQDSPVYETESKNVETNEVCSMSWHRSSPSMLLVFTANSWQIFELSDLNRLVTYYSDVQICDGKLLSGERAAVCRADGTIYIYQLHHPVDLLTKPTIGAVGDPSLLVILQGSVNENPWPSHTLFCMLELEKYYSVCCIDSENSINLWEFDEISRDHSQNKVLLQQPKLRTSMEEQWQMIKHSPPPICDFKLSCRRLCGHRSAVTCFLYPHEEHSRYDRQVLVSGANDFSVITWNLNTGSILYRFCVQGGPILRMLIPPENCSPRILHTICSVAGDNSVALLSLKEKRCLLLASRQLFPIVDIKWRPLDDFMLLKCEDESVYIWQMDTASLERIVNGQASEEILLACDGVTEVDDEAGASQAVQMFRALKNKNIAAMKQIATGGRVGKVTSTTEKAVELPPPMNIQAINKKPDSPHLVFFNIDSLIAGLLSIENELTSGETMENKSLSTILMGKQQPEPRSAAVPKVAWQTGSNHYLDVAKLCM